MNAIRATGRRSDCAVAADRLAGRGASWWWNPSAHGEKIGLTEEEWRDDPAAIADWDALRFPHNRADGLGGRGTRGVRTVSRGSCQFNIEAVRKQMEQMTGDDAQ